MHNTEILNVIKKGLLDSITGLKQEEIHFDSHLKNDLRLDSLSSMFFLTYLEDHLLGFEVNPNTIEARDFNTVESIYKYIQQELKVTSSI